MSQPLEHVSKWFYRGIWGVLTKWFHVPQEPPQLPILGGEPIQSFKPSNGFLRYLKFQFWLALLFINSGLFVGWFAITVASPLAGVLVSPFGLILLIAPEVVAYLAIHLRYDTTWYVMSDRSLRIRRGIWVIHETTITFENVQNVAVNQGPLQRFFRIANVTVQTAGGGGITHGKESPSMAAAHHGLIEGVENASEIRDLIMSRLKKSRASGLGDELDGVHHATAKPAWTAAHIGVLREIRDLIQTIGSSQQSKGAL